ncbi:MAG: ankyrin repeat domain-containing protein [Acidobacteria bacterium]|nr:ankyrin repeat domain-containing protein [Acidobacteriota bacterium]
MTTRDDFLAAVTAGDTAEMEGLLAEDPSLAEARDGQGVSAVLLAAYHGQPAARDLLAGRKATLDVFEAAALGDCERLGTLVGKDLGAARAVSPDGFPVVALAAFFGRLAAVQLLLAAGADPNVAAANEMRVTALHAAVAQRDPVVSLALVRLLLAHRARLNVTQRGGWTPLHATAAHGPTEQVRLLLEHGADARATTDDGKTALDLAEAAGRADNAALLRAAVAG